MAKSRFKIVNRTHKKLILGGCVATLAAGAFIGENVLVSKYNFGDLPLMINDYGNKCYSENKNATLVLTLDFENTLKNCTDDEQIFVIDSIKNAVKEFNDLTDYYNYSVSASTDSFKKYGLEKYELNDGYNIPLSIDNVLKDNSLAITHTTYLPNGKITSAKIDFFEDTLFYLWDRYTTGDFIVPKNSVFCSVLEHELMHTIGFEDIYDLNKKSKTIMYYKMCIENSSFTDYDKECMKNLQEVLESEQLIINADKKSKIYNNVFNQKYLQSDELEK